MEFKKEDVKDILDQYDLLLDKITDIVNLHGKLDDCYYQITEITYSEYCLLVNVEYYKWQDTNFSTIPIDLELLSDKDSFDKFKTEMSNKIQEKIDAKNLEAHKAKEREIEKARQLLRENGITEI